MSESGELFFDFRGMYMALLVFDNQECCTLIDTVLRCWKLATTCSTTEYRVYKGTENLCFDEHCIRYSSEINDQK